MSSWSSRGSEVGDQFVRSGRYLVNPPLEFGGYKVATPLTAYPPYHLRCGTPASREVSTPELEERSRSGDSTYFVLSRFSLFRLSPVGWVRGWVPKGTLYIRMLYCNPFSR